MTKKTQTQIQINLHTVKWHQWDKA